MARKKREGLSKKTRFEIFKRDSFTCQYCGAKAPDSILNVDHIKPVADGGKNNILNLITSCSVCNSGKGATSLTDNTVIEKQREQLDQLQARREQLDMLFEWQRGLVDLEDIAVNQISRYWSDKIPQHVLTESGAREIKKYIHKYGVNEVIEAINFVASNYVKYDSKDNTPTIESVGIAFYKIPKICSYNRLIKEKPYMQELFYIRGIARNKFAYCNEWEAKNILIEAYELGVSINDLKKATAAANNWTSWTLNIELLVEGKKEEARRA